MKKFDDALEARKNRASYLKDDILRMLEEGKKAREIAQELGIRQGMVYYYDRQYGGKEEKNVD